MNRRRCGVVSAGTLAFVLCASIMPTKAAAKECWVATEVKGQSAMSVPGYAFSPDAFHNPMVLCFNGDERGSVSGDDTPLTQFGSSTLAGYVNNNGLELFEVYQIDRSSGRLALDPIRWTV